MTVFGTEIDIETFRLPEDGSKILNRIHIQIDGVWYWFRIVFDCECHLRSEDADLDICIYSNQPEVIHHDCIKPCGATTVCTRNCTFKKARAQKELDEHGPWLSDEIKAYLQKILESEDEVSISS